MNIANQTPLRRLYAGLCLTLIVSGLSAQNVIYNIEDLPGGEDYLQIRDATRTADGIVAVGAGSQLSGSNQGDTAIMWNSASGEVTALQNLDTNNTTATSFVAARVISADGTVIGGSSHYQDTGNRREATLWTNNGSTTTGLGFFPDSVDNYSFVNGLSTDGKVACGTASDSNDCWQAFRYTASGGKVGLGFLNSSDYASIPCFKGVSADGTVIAGNSGSGANQVGTGNMGFVYNYTGVGATQGTMTALPTLTGGKWTYALSITSDGSKILGVADTATNPNGVAVLWSRQGGTISTVVLGTPDATATSDIVAGITNDGSVALMNFFNDSSYTSYLRNANGWFDLRLALKDSGMNMTGWSQLIVAGVSGDGTLLWGSGLYDGRNEGWVADVQSGYLAAIPEPSITTLLMGTLGFSTVAWIRRRKK